jgi:phosphotransferase system HPr (HPr) family protein
MPGSYLCHKPTFIECQERPLTATLEITVIHEVGLHARPAALFVKAASEFSSEITVENLNSDSGVVNAKSILGILASAVQKDHQIRIIAEGEDEEQALIKLRELIESNFEKK